MPRITPRASFAEARGRTSWRASGRNSVCRATRSTLKPIATADEAGAAQAGTSTHYSSLGPSARPRPLLESIPVVRAQPKFIFVTGGVASGLGKGITTASLGRLFKSRGLRTTLQKLDPYINVDPGTMNPFEHGEVFVLDDGAETDLDLGHYERYTDESLHRESNVTTGAVYQTVIGKERRGEVLGKTVQVIPHLTP